jgi:hypothetical protein
MKYIVNEQNSCGQASLTEAQRNEVLSALGYEVKEEEQLQESVAHEVEQETHEDTEMPTLYEWDDAVFALEEEVFEIDGNLFLRAIELDNETKSHINESHADLFINQVDFDETEYDLGDIYDYGDDIYIRMDEAYAMKEGDKKGDKSKDKPDDKPDYTTGMRKGDKSNMKKDADDKGDFETGQRKGDKSKTHAGKDFEDVKKK